jgi:bifunctional DNase/RNase
LLIPVEIASFAVDPEKGSPVLILKESLGSRTVALPIGPFEASAIAFNTLNVVPEKPMTVDLVKAVIENLGGCLDRVVLHDYVGGSYLSRLQVVSGASVHLIECTSSDAVALALRCGCPIFTTEAVFAKRSSQTVQSPRDALRQAIAGVDTVDFGRYYLE